MEVGGFKLLGFDLSKIWRRAKRLAWAPGNAAAIEDQSPPPLITSNPTIPQKPTPDHGTVLQPDREIGWSASSPGPEHQAGEIGGELSQGSKIHHGEYADILKGTWTAPGASPIPVAIKQLRFVRMSAQLFSSPEAQTAQIEKCLKGEVYIWEKLKHRNVTPLLGYRSDDQPLLVTPFYQNGNILQYLVLHPGASRIRLLVQAAQGLLYLHQSSIVHGDIKPDNVLINDVLEASLCDFGLSRILQTYRTSLTTLGQPEGDKGYIAPELLLEDATQSKTTASDVFAFGSLILHIMSGKAPFHRKTVPHAILDICRGRLPPQDEHPAIPVESSLWALMHRCWAMDPAWRPSTQEVLDALVAEERAESSGRLQLSGAQTTEESGK